ncbi:Leucine-rich repeat-containing protein 74A [Collichthys lucidus]|uniref:Leucine-rich repeat-containing protein 74A n=1 Tax=Collichthys lucidus TaxID=240159 RepID=A0A4U5UN77_COLLU|nr:Leucine-rich repeat-containing protein 74A [Collichthys lucidus]
MEDGAVLDQTDDEELPPQDQDCDPGDEWDTDLETDDATSRRRSSSRAELYLQACQEIGVHPVSSFLRNLSETSLDLNHYGVGPLGAKALAVALRKDRVITRLELEDNRLGATGTHYLIEMLMLNNSIESLVTILKLSRNEFDDSAIKYIAEALKLNSTLKHLHLSWNGFGHFETEKLGQALKQNSTLVLLDLSGNHIDDEAVTLMCQGLAANNTLRVLKKFLKMKNESIMDFFQALDKEGTMKVSTSAFRTAVKVRLTLTSIHVNDLDRYSRK